MGCLHIKWSSTISLKLAELHPFLFVKIPYRGMYCGVYISSGCKMTGGPLKPAGSLEMTAYCDFQRTHENISDWPNQGCFGKIVID